MSKKLTRAKILRDEIQIKIINGEIDNYASLIMTLRRNKMEIRRNGDNYLSFHDTESLEKGNSRIYFEFPNPTKHQPSFCKTGMDRFLELKKITKKRKESDGSYIYCLYINTEPFPTCYIGQTTNIQDRMTKHIELFRYTRENISKIINDESEKITSSMFLFIRSIVMKKPVMISILDKITKVKEHDYKKYLDMESRWFTSAYLYGWNTPGALRDETRKSGWGKINNRLDLIPEWDHEGVLSRGVNLSLNINFRKCLDLSPRSNLELFDISG